MLQKKEERKRYIAELSKVDGLRVIPSKANYIMCEITNGVTNGVTVKELNRRLIVEHNILIKNLVAKLKQDGRQYIRIAVRTTEENDKLIAGIKDVLN